MKPPFHPVTRLPAVPLAIVLFTFSFATHRASAFEEPSRWPFKQGDRVVLVGDTLIERDQRYGYLETFLTIENPELNLTFRNLGWSGDTVRGLSRAGFDPPEAGLKALKEQLTAAKPTVVIVGYGMAESFDGAAGLSRFEEGLNDLLDFIATMKARLILLSPIPHEDLGRPLPDPAAHNRDIRLYAEAIRKAADHHNARYIDLLDGFPATRYRYTDNGIHLTGKGYYVASHAILSRLGCKSADPGRELTIDSDGKPTEAKGLAISELSRMPETIRFAARRDRLPFPPHPNSDDVAQTDKLRFGGLAPGRYMLKVDGKTLGRGEAGDWEKGVSVSAPELEQTEQLRKTINEKNLLFFHRWRPQNITYLFGFRKHEQGNNAIEVPKFDPLVEAKEQEIARLRRPMPHQYELVREVEVSR